MAPKAETAGAAHVTNIPIIVCVQERVIISTPLYVSISAIPSASKRSMATMAIPCA